VIRGTRNTARRFDGGVLTGDVTIVTGPEEGLGAGYREGVAAAGAEIATVVALLASPNG